MRELLEEIRPLLNTRPMFGTFSLGDGSAWFCAACGERSGERVPGAPPTTASQTIPHKKDCSERAHWRAIEVLKAAIDGFTGGE